MVYSKQASIPSHPIMPPKSKSKKEHAVSATPINFYQRADVQKFSGKTRNPGFAVHNVAVPFRGVVIGSSGAGKTNWLMNMIHLFKDTFNHIYIFTQAEEPLYSYLDSKIDSSLLTIVYNDLGKLNFDKFYGQSLCIFDDMVNETDKAQSKIKELYIRGRKLGVSLLYLTQSYFQVPKLIRMQCNYVFILKLSGIRDLRLMLTEYSLGATKDQLQKMYEYVRESGMENFFMIDLQANDNKTYRKNWNEFLEV